MKTRYVIFADDDADDLELVTGYFRQYDRETQVLEFRDGKEVMDFLNQFSTASGTMDLIVLDINMPRLNGMETLSAIRNHPRFKNVPVVIYTTSISAADQSFCENLNASWVCKPSSIEDVKEIARVLAEFCANLH